MKPNENLRDIEEKIISRERREKILNELSQAL